MDPQRICRLCVVGLAPGHPLLQGSNSVEEVDFNVGRVNRMDAAPRGKWKKGGQRVEPDSAICKLRSATGAEFVVRYQKLQS